MLLDALPNVSQRVLHTLPIFREIPVAKTFGTVHFSLVSNYPIVLDRIRNRTYTALRLLIPNTRHEQLSAHRFEAETVSFELRFMRVQILGE